MIHTNTQFYDCDRTFIKQFKFINKRQACMNGFRKIITRISL